MVRRDIARLRGELFRLQQLLRPQRDMLASGGELLERLPGLEGEASRHPFREVHDVLVSTVGRVDYLRELLGKAVGIYLSSNANRLNALATRLALLGTIFLPLTFVDRLLRSELRLARPPHQLAPRLPRVDDRADADRPAAHGRARGAGDPSPVALI